MKYVDEFRRQDLAHKLSAAIKKAADPQRSYNLMEFCGGHTHAIFRYGVQKLMPDNVSFVHGPGCPVCVLPIGRIDNAIQLASKPDVILCTYSDLMRVPASGRNSLLKTKAEGADIRMVYSTLDALKIARDNPEKEVVFFAIGFETTTPPTALAIKQAQKEQIKNFSVFCNHVLTPSAMRSILEAPRTDSVKSLVIDGFLGPSHVSTIIGSQPYEIFADEFYKPIVIAGFEPLDVMQSSLMLIRQINEGRHEVGMVKNSALQIKADFAEFDTEKRFNVSAIHASDIKGCECPQILRGVKRPTDCKLFGTVCTPENPMGSCMVSSEGACAAYWSYGRFNLSEPEGYAL